jgi:hypothetical protein
MNTRWQKFTTLILLLAFLAACGGSGEDRVPTVRILSPLDPHTVAVGENLMIESRARDDKGVSQMELRVNEFQVGFVEVPEGEKSFLVHQTWRPSEPGVYSVVVVAYDTQEQMSEPARLTVNVEPGPTPPPSPDSMPTPSPEATEAALPSSTPGQAPTAPSGCTYNAVFVTDVTIPDDTQMTPGAELVKTWRMRNSGTCDWGPGVQLVFVEGEQMGGPASVGVPSTAAGSTADIEAPLVAPQEPGTYRGTWRLRAPDGEEFGERPYVQIVVVSGTTIPTETPTVTAAPKADLDITLISGDLKRLVGEPVALQVTVRNHGPAATDRVALLRAIFRPGLEIEGTVPTLPANGEVMASISHVFHEPVELDVVVSVDPDDEIDEADESNNTAQVPLVVNPPLYVTRTITVTPGLSFDLDDDTSEDDRSDITWQVAEGTVFLASQNGAGTAPLSGDAENVSYILVSGLAWEPEQLAILDLVEGYLFGFNTSDGRVGYGHVDAVLDESRTTAQITYLVWDWP